MALHRRISTTAALALTLSVTTAGTALAAAGAPPTARTLTAASAAAYPVFQAGLPAPTGRYAAGEDVIHLTDWDRPDPWVPSAGPRQLTVSLFYPAVAGTGTQAPYMTLAEAAGFLQDKAPGSGLPPSALAAATTHAYDGARAVRGKHPLVVLSPGFGDTRATLTSLATELASRGYVVALIGHTYEDSGETLADGQTPGCAICENTPAAPPPAVVAASRALDVSFVLDQLTDGDHAWRLAGLIDKHSIGMAGHSLGGAAATHTMISDPRVLAGADMDGTFHPVPPPGAITRPFLMLGTTIDHTSDGADRSWSQTYANLGGYKRWLAVSGANHSTFTDIPLLAQQAGRPEPPGIDPLRGLALTREYVSAFFDQTLKGICQPLLEGPAPENPEVLFQY